MYRVSINFSPVYRQLWETLRQYLLENLCRILLTFVMAQHANLYTLLLTHITVVMHLTGQKGISLLSQSLIQKEVPCPATNGDTQNRTLKQLVVHQTLTIEGILHAVQEETAVHLSRQIANHTAVTKRNDIYQTQLDRNAVIDTVLSFVKISMCTVYRDVILYGQTYHTLNIRTVADTLQSMEQHRMMAYYQVTSHVHSLTNHSLGDIQAQ